MSLSPQSEKILIEDAHTLERGTELGTVDFFSSCTFPPQVTKKERSPQQSRLAQIEELDTKVSEELLCSILKRLGQSIHSSFLGREEFQALLESGFSHTQIPKRVRFAPDTTRIHEGDSYLIFKDKIMMCEPWPESKEMLRSLARDEGLPEVASSLLHELAHRHQVPKSISRTLKAIRYGALPALGGCFALFGTMTFVYGAVAFGALYAMHRYSKSRYTKEEAELRHSMREIPSEIHANLIERSFALHPYGSFSQEAIHSDILFQLMPYEESAYTPASIDSAKAERFIKKATVLIDALLLLDTPDTVLRDAIFFESADFEECRFPELESLFEQQRQIHNQLSEECSFEEKLSDLAAQRERNLNQARKRAQTLLRASLQEEAPHETNQLESQ